MKSIFFYSVLFVSIFYFNQSEAQQAKVNLGLIHYVNENPNASLNLLVQGDVIAITNFCTSHNSRVKYFAGDISSITISSPQLHDLIHTPGIERVEGYHGFGKVLDDQSDKNVFADSVKQGVSPLPQALDGDSVVVGILDTGIDFHHPDFKNANGTSRIKYLWDQTVSTGGITPSFGYGQEWTASDIDNNSCTHNEASQYFGHGSNVSGAAAGNGLATGQYPGIAPNSDIISVSVDLGNNFLNNVADATQYIYAKANALGKPCVISASVGTYSGSHDATDLPAQLISQLINGSNGRSFCASAGNAGLILLHLGYTVEADSAYSWFRYEPSIGRVYYELWAKKSDFNNVNFKIGVDKPSPSFAKRASSSYYNVLNDFDLSSGLDSVNYNFIVGPNNLGKLTIYVNDYNDSTYQIGVKVITDSTSYLWRLTTKGSGYFDCWSQPSYTGTSNILKAGLPPVGTHPEIARYRLPNSNQTICSSFQCADPVLCVANYTNRTSFTNNNNTITNYPSDTTGARVLSSSKGPTRVGGIKPDITAPGGNTLAPGQLTILAQLIINDPSKVAVGGYHNVNGGTSMASPVCAGVVALYMQQNPNASNSEIKNNLQVTAIQDNYTGTSLPNSIWGYGKVNAFDFIKQSLCTCTTPVSVSVNNITSSKATISWLSASTCDTKYRLQYRQTGTIPFTTLFLTYNEFQKVIKSLSPATTYQYRVRAQCSVDGTTMSPWSPMQSFTTLPSTIFACSTPLNISSTSITGTSAVVIWSTINGAYKYRLRYRKVGTSNWTNKVVSSASTSKLISGLSLSTNYEYQLRTQCDASGTSFSQYSPTYSFTTLSLRLDENIDTNNLIIYPNPTNGLTTISYNLESEINNLNLVISDIAGRIIRVNSLNQNTGVITLDLSELSKGVYFVRLFNNEKEVMVNKLIKN